MANDKASATEKRSNTPLLIIGLVLVVGIIGGWWFYVRSASKPPTNSNDNKTMAPKKSDRIPPDAPLGAQPPRQAGSASATVTLEEFADFQCPQCAMEHPTMNEIKSTYGTRINFIFREYPLDIKAHDKSYEAAVAAEAAGMQNKFWEMQNILFTNQKAWTDNPDYKNMWKEYAQRIGLDINKWEADQAGMVARRRVEEDKKRGKGIGLMGTPSLFVNGQAVQLPDMTVENLKKIIDAELAKNGAPGQPAQEQNGQPAQPKKPSTNETTAID